MCFGKGVDERLATRAIRVAVQPDAEGSRVGHFAGEKLFTRDFCYIYCYLRLHSLQTDQRQPRAEHDEPHGGSPFFTHVANWNAAPISLPAQAALGNILKSGGNPLPSYETRIAKN